MASTPLAGRIHIIDAALEEWPLAAGSIISGTPRTHGAFTARSEDNRRARGLWSCTPGSFRWEWHYDESLVVVAGRARVHIDGGPVIEIAAGDFAWFDQGQSAVWETIEPMRKAFHAFADGGLPF